MTRQLATETSTNLGSTPNKVLVVDSGVGGLSICKSITDQLPGISLSYLSDNAAFPYGNKPANVLIERLSLLLHSAVNTLSPDIIVIACNTASTIALPTVRDSIDLPIVGVVPAIKPAAMFSKSKIIALLATPGTVSRDYTKKLIAKYASDCHIVSLGNSSLVKHIEEHLHGSTLDRVFLKQIVDELKDKAKKINKGDIDTVVLGCTHFPLIKSVWTDLEPSWAWIDSGEAIADRVKSLLASIEKPEKNSKQKHPAHLHHAWFTRKPQTLEQLENYLNDIQITAKHKSSREAAILKV